MPSDLSHYYRRTCSARKIIVVDLGFLGDTVHLVPALWDLKAGYPQAALHVVTSPVGAEVLRLVSCVDRAWAVEMRRDHRTLSQQWQIVRALRSERFEVAFNFSGADRTLFLTALTGARWRVAYPGGRRHFWNRWLVANWAPRHDPNQMIFERHRQMLADCGLPLAPPRFDLKVDESSLAWAGVTVIDPAMHLSPNAAKVTREWPLEHHVALLRMVWAEHPTLHVLASASANQREQERLRALAASVSDTRLHLLPDDLSIPQLAAVLTRCRLHIGPDSGVLHLAAALGVPTISFFREQGDYKSFMPVGPRHQVISMPCHCIDNRHAPCERLGRAECFERIEPARVAALVCDHLRTKKAAEFPRHPDLS